MRRVLDHVDRLLRQRRPRRFVPTEEEAAVLRAAITLRAARPDSGLPDSAFVSDLHARLTEQHRRAGEVETDEPARPDGQSRRRLLLAATAAASAAAAVGADRALVGDVEPSPVAAPTLQPNEGVWHPVLRSDELAEGAVRAFDAGSVSGFVLRRAGALSARSGVCTHQGCRLGLEVEKLACPCHRTSFALDGQVIASQLRTPPPRLPAFAVREQDGEVQVLVPRAAPEQG